MKYKVENSAGGIVYKIPKGYFVPHGSPSAANKSWNKKGESQVLWLITQHSQHKGWGFPKGLIGDNIKDEPMEEAAIREVREEGGVVAKIITRIPQPAKYKYRFKDTLVDKTVYYFLMEYLSGDPKNHDLEVSDIKFTTADDVKKTLTYKSDQEPFIEALNIFNKLS